MTIEGQNRITLTSIQGVISFSAEQILLSDSNGRIRITGKELKIVSFSKQNGTFAATGTVLGVQYLSKSEKLRNRIFK